MTEPEFRRNDSKHRYEIVIDGEAVGFSQYRDRDSTRDVFHTEVDSNWTGHGLATRLLAFVLDDIRTSGQTLKATCPMLAAYLEKHPEQKDLLVPR